MDTLQYKCRVEELKLFKLKGQDVGHNVFELYKTLLRCPVVLVLQPSQLVEVVKTCRQNPKYITPKNQFM